jgi:hypothetical protein
MRESKLIEILKTFTAAEWKTFEKFAASPYFSTGRDVSGLFNLIKKHFPDFSSDELDKEKAYRIIFPAEAFNEKKLKNLSSDLTRLAEQFLAHEHLRSDEALFEESLAAAYKDKKSEKLFLKTLNSLDRKISEIRFDSDAGFAREEKLERLKEGYYLAANKFDKSVPIRIKYTEYSILTFLISFLRKQRDIYIIEHSYNMDFRSPLIDSVNESIDFDKMLGLLKKRKSEWLWLIEIYYYAVKSIQNTDNITLIEKFKKLFFANIDKFSHREKYFIFNDFIAWIHFRDSKTGAYSIEEEFQITKKMLENNAYSPSDKDYLHVVLYRNILIMAISLKEYKWFERFIEEYTPRLKPEFRENMKNLATANLHFEKGNFDDALTCLGSIPYDVFVYKIDIKNLMLRVYYELELFDQAFSLIDAFKHFLSDSDEFSDYFKTQHSNFLVLYNKLLKAKSNNNFKDVGFISKEIEKKENVASKGWLLEKAKEMMV